MTDSRATEGPWRVTRVATTGSTNADLLAAARAGEPSGAVLVTDHQQAGRGRLGRAWEAPPGTSLMLSVLVRPTPAAAARLHGVTQAMALAARTAVTAVAGATPELKWPNDLLVGSRKLAGILAETVVEDGKIAGVVVGMGLNVNWPAQLPAELAERAVALNHVVGHPIDREALLGAVLAQLAPRVDQWQEGRPELAREYRAVLGTLGQRVRVEVGEGALIGTAADVGDDGRLIVRLDDGEERVVSAGDVTHLRPA